MTQGCATLVDVAYDQHDQKSGDLGADGKLFCVDPYAGDSKVVDSDQIRSEPEAALKQGKSTCLKLEGQGQKISITGAERNAAKVEVGSRRTNSQQRALCPLISQTGNWDVQRCHLFGAANSCSSYRARNEVGLQRAKLERLKIFRPTGCIALWMRS